MAEQKDGMPSKGNSDAARAEMPPRMLPSRACTECRRKKSKCDMKRPECSLCFRIGETCIYPARRAPGRKRHMATQHGHEKTFNALQDSRSSVGTSDGNCSIAQALPNDNYSRLESLDFTSCSPDFTWHDPCNSLNPFVDQPIELKFGFNIPSYSSDNIMEVPAKIPELPFMSTWPEDHDVPLTISSNSDRHESPFVSGHGTKCLLTPHTATLGATDLGTGFDALDSQCSFQIETYDVDMPPSVALRLIDEFFEYVHCCLPLFHSERFKKRYEYLHHAKTCKVSGISLESALVLNGMFSLCARFSTADIFHSEEPLHRGDRFFEEALRLYDLSCKKLTGGDTTLEYVQGVIILTFNALQSCPSRQGWLLSSVCCRLAFELGLHNTDTDIVSGVTDEACLPQNVWRDREERRRAWWVVWDMDTFANALALTPFALDLRWANVLVPVPDDAWIGPRRIASTYLDANSPSPWKRLSHLPEQSSWAWFLAGTIVLRRALEAVQRQKLGDQALDDLDAHACCFAMALPEVFQLGLNALSFDDHNFGEMNWVMSTLIMLQFSRSFVRLQRTTINILQLNGRDDHLSSDIGGQRSQKLHDDTQSAEDYRHFQKEMSRIAKAWSPRYLVFSTPLITFSLVGPAFVHVLEIEKTDFLGSLSLDTLKLALKRLARYWTIAKGLLDKLQAVELERATEGMCMTTTPTTMPHKKEYWPPILKLCP